MVSTSAAKVWLGKALMVTVASWPMDTFRMSSSEMVMGTYTEEMSVMVRIVA